jgi:hypothetical protein
MGSYARNLRAEFERLRSAQKDSAVKGAGNEMIVGQFLEQHLQPRRVVYNSSIIDAKGGQSDEVDVAVCNFEQPFITGDRAQLLLVEGVDVVVQVKAMLNTTEIKRRAASPRSPPDPAILPGSAPTNLTEPRPALNKPNRRTAQPKVRNGVSAHRPFG